jgi:archaellum component FlaC
MIAPNDSALQVFYGTVPVVGAILLANWNNNKRLDDLNKRIDDVGTHLNKRIDDLTVQMNVGFSDVKTAISKLETRVSDLEKAYLVRP